MVKNVSNMSIIKNYLDIVVIKNQDYKYYENNEGNIIIEVEHKGFFWKIAQKVLKKSKISKIMLDNYGTKLFNSIDGEKNILEVVNYMKEIFPEEKDIFERAIVFIYLLQKNNFIVIK